MIDRNSPELQKASSHILAVGVALPYDFGT
jgi:hypothetical protein